MNEETIQAARAAWRRNPEDAAMALLGITPEELFVQAIRGCNQHKHKQGCPDAIGGTGSTNANSLDSNAYSKLRSLAADARKNGDKISVYYSANEGEDVYPEDKAETIRVRFSAPELKRGVFEPKEKSIERLSSYLKSAGINVNNNAVEWFDYDKSRGDGYGPVKLSLFPSSGEYEYSFPFKRK